ncbi:Putative isoprenoid synthase domain superfamily, terpene cyclase-like 2 [Septoria linicola]|uniref:Terpene synthase n=1 Tax=Septoria linicola TaxID=215465 RepID=A0A9Q9ASY0_9PEZI|nr:putative isoprenoid synthase domain superfamily, terpene cyclase-like 2 [Septoria linicola]USW54545.1 Putative isoprenoid synthase domain superfamily, terpene cyclase-like 2 [Septoria linicola]
MSLTGSSEPDVGRTIVKLPDLFQSFIQAEPHIRSDYIDCKRESCQWLSDRLAFDEKASRILSAGDFTWFAAVYVPNTAYKRFRIVSDWTNLIFYYDDLFDNGDLKDDPVRTKATIDRLFAAIDGDILPADPNQPDLDYVDKVQAAHDDFWQRFRALASPSQQRFYRRAMAKFLTGALKQVEDCSEEYGRSLDEILARRSDSVGMDPCYPMVCFAYNLEIPDDVMQSAPIQELEQISCELCGLQNDVVSYRKEESENVTHNMIAVCRLHGMKAQEAHDHVALMIDLRLNRINTIVAALPRWGQDIDAQVAVYVQGIKRMIASNVHWSFRSQRYFGLRNKQVRKTGLVDLLQNPPYLQNEKA